ncbi:MAG TPA: hypothetical protein VFZ05_00560 [Nitrososphaera sp.]
MIIGPRRAILIGAIVAIALTIILIPLIFSATAPDFSRVRVSLSNMTVASADEDLLQLRPVITIENPTDQTITTSRIEYELFADGTPLGTHTVSFEDIPLNGRPAIFAGGSVAIPPLTGQLYELEYDDSIADLYAKIRDNPESVQWRASGDIVLESTLVQQPVQFDSTL